MLNVLSWEVETWKFIHHILFTVCLNFFHKKLKFLREGRLKFTTYISKILEHNFTAFFFYILKLLIHLVNSLNLSWFKILTILDCLTNSGKLNPSIQFQLHCEIHQIQRGTLEVEVVVTKEKRDLINYI